MHYRIEYIGDCYKAIELNKLGDNIEIDIGEIPESTLVYGKCVYSRCESCLDVISIRTDENKNLYRATPEKCFVCKALSANKLVLHFQPMRKILVEGGIVHIIEETERDIGLDLKVTTFMVVNGKLVNYNCQLSVLDIVC